MENLINGVDYFEHCSPNGQYGENVWLGDGPSWLDRTLKIVAGPRTIITTNRSILYVTKNTFSGAGQYWAILKGGEEIRISEEFYNLWEKVSEFEVEEEE